MIVGKRDLTNLDDCLKYSLNPPVKVFECSLLKSYVRLEGRVSKLNDSKRKCLLESGIIVNQEDSVIINHGAIQRGLFWATTYKTSVS